MSDFRDDFKKAVYSATKSTEAEKERMWRRIDAEIKVNEMRKKRSAAGWMAASIILAVLVVFTAFTPTGRAAVNRIIALFAAEKTVTTTVEGEQEEAVQDLYVDGGKEEAQVVVSEAPEEDKENDEQKPVRYVLYIDEERYTMVKGDNEDIIVPKDYPQDYPPVDMRISQKGNQSVDSMTDEIFTQLNDAYDNVYDAEPVSFAHISGQKLAAFNGDINGDKETMPQWDDEVTKVYIFDNTLGGVFVIRIRYFMEAEEGHGARMEQMLDQFEIISAE